MELLKYPLSVVAMGLLLAGGAAAGGERDVEENEESSAATSQLGPEVDRICFGRSINGWREVKGEDNVILLERGVNDWYRVELIGMCRYRILRTALAIELDQRPGGGCVRRGDNIIVRERPNLEYRCSIRRMYEWNIDAPEGDDAAPDETEE